ncbi:cupin-like domain-containing protein [Sphingomonas sp. 2R-10]|uniref:cupin-like domain-containing protein n=1 Tax=Sphingomonas sp. 2R-10 TaxID=3045148 RepID=UPI000F7B95D3|nr:cupin-like domain-containing protein [Sphingomonas sp. 2R-10]MDJ0276105.1 cupin-like domain-containing protein [Sphingomonas sp. 2R-10]
MTPPRPVRVIEGARLSDLSPVALVAANEPVVLRGIAADWPLVAAGRAGPAAAIAYLKQFDGGRPIVGYTGDPAIGGRFFYRDDWSGLNFDAGRIGLCAYLDRIERHLDDPESPAFYIGSTDLDAYLPGLRTDNDLSLPPLSSGAAPPLASIWIGNRTVAATHYDMSNNLAVCVVGRRRFTLFPPDQVAKLYPGPLEPTPGGQVVSMVDLRAPDLDRHPRFAEALAHAQVADLEPGDVLFYPALWWHNVEALASFNVLMNYWWNDVPAFVDSPMTTLLHALLSLRERPAAERAAWAAMFDHYVWSGGDGARAHLPMAIHGDLAPLDEPAARRLRARLLQRLNR